MDTLITILGATATGKTTLAANLALQINGEIISADSRQVYRKLDIGTGKDLNEYTINGQKIPYHLIDIYNLGEEYNVFKFQENFHKAYNSIKAKGKTTILCGGTGMYIQAVLDNYKMYPIPKDEKLRTELENKSHSELIAQLHSVTNLHNSTDTIHKKRTIKAIEIALYCNQEGIEKEIYPPLKSITFGINTERSIVKERITKRLKYRLENGMIEEVENLIANGVTFDQLKFLGLEYKFLAMYLNNEISYSEMESKLTIAIHQFSKRQMTWFRRMEKQGHQIHWIDGSWSLKQKIEYIQTIKKSQL